MWFLKKYFLYLLFFNVCIIYRVKEYGVVGYRLLDNKLFVFVDGFLIMEKDKKM